MYASSVRFFRLHEEIVARTSHGKDSRLTNQRKEGIDKDCRECDTDATPHWSLFDGHIVPVAPLHAERRTSGRWDYVPSAIGRSEHGDIGLAVTVIVARHRNVSAITPRNADRKPSARLNDVPRPIRRPKYGDIQLA